MKRMCHLCPSSPPKIEEQEMLRFTWREGSNKDLLVQVQKYSYTTVKKRT